MKRVEVGNSYGKLPILLPFSNKHCKGLNLTYVKAHCCSHTLGHRGDGHDHEACNIPDMRVVIRFGRVFAPPTLPDGRKDTKRGFKITFNTNSADLLKLHIEKEGHQVEYETSPELPARAICVLVKTRVVGESTYRLLRKPYEVDRLLKAIGIRTVAKKPKSGRRKRLASSKKAKGPAPEDEEEEEEEEEEERLECANQAAQAEAVVCPFAKIMRKSCVRHMSTSREELAHVYSGANGASMMLQVQPQNSLVENGAQHLNLLRNLASAMDQLVFEGSTYLRNAAEHLNQSSQQSALLDSPLKEVVESMAVALERHAKALDTVHQTALSALASSEAQPLARQREEEAITHRRTPSSNGSSRKKRPTSAPTQRAHFDGAHRNSDTTTMRKNHLRASSKSSKRCPIWRPVNVDMGIPKLK
eukprot:1194397-Prorocentrum_minimum.AAC.3